MDIHFSKVFALLEPSCKGKLSSNVLDQESTKQNLLHHVGTELKFMGQKFTGFQNHIFGSYPYEPNNYDIFTEKVHYFNE